MISGGLGGLGGRSSPTLILGNTFTLKAKPGILKNPREFVGHPNDRSTTDSLLALRFWGLGHRVYRPLVIDLGLRFRGR